MHKFDYKFLKDKIPAKLLNLAAIIYDIKGKEEIRTKTSTDLFNKLKDKAIRESIKGSNAIENISTTDKRINEISNGDSKGLTHEEKEIIGYRNVLNNIHIYYQTIKFDKTTILGLHKELLDVARIESRGSFKKEDNVISEHKNGKRIVIFIPTSPKYVESSINDLVNAYNDAIHDKDINPLLLIPCVILDFLCIHPFDDGNGRISRILTLLLLYKSNFDIGKFISIENMINDHKESYYQALHDSSIDWHNNKNNYEPFIIYMIQILYRCYIKLDEYSFESIDRKLSKSERVEKLLLNSIVPISKRTIADKLINVSDNLIEMVIVDLLKKNKIKKIGDYKNAKYYRK